MSTIRLLLALIAGACLGGLAVYAAPRFSPASTTTPAPRPAPADNRIVVTLTDADRQYIRQQMIGYLEGLYVLSDAQRHEDFETLRSVSETFARPDPVSAEILKDAPDGFRQISQAMRSDFASLGLASEPGKAADLDDTFGSILLKCSACHGTYRADSP
ncbi:MAG: hypothetical protein ACK4MQ_10415 [Hyphomonas sp.]